MSKRFTIFGSEIFIPEITFYGQYRRSPNKQYLLAFGESIEDSFERVVLLEDHEILVNKRLKGVRHAQVSDPGVFILDTWSDQSVGTSQILVMDMQGKNVMSESVQSSITCMDLSCDGKFAVCQTGYSEHADDSTKLIFIDILNKCVLWKKSTSDWIVKSSIDTAQRSLNISFRHGPSCAYRFDGSRILESTTS